MIELVYTGCCSFKSSIESTTANRITAFRLAMLPFYVFFHFTENMEWAFWLSLIIIVLDAVDGYVARALGEESEFGAKFDPVVDKVSIAVLFFVATSALKNAVPANLWLTLMVKAAILFSVESSLLIIGFYSIIKKIKGGSNIFGKCKMYIECAICIGSYNFLFIVPGEFMPEQIAEVINLSLNIAICFAFLSFIFHIKDFLEGKQSLT